MYRGLYWAGVRYSEDFGESAPRRPFDMGSTGHAHEYRLLIWEL